ncbi:hypothetical protein [Aquipseudomonas alcaligenes]|jgi:hypothetical protein|uniref:hypothetical protein n=1 Tax=Aquipseudomonas alcaligenes TaxID=43263 RepID=UPI00364C8055
MLARVNAVEQYLQKIIDTPSLFAASAIHKRTLISQTALAQADLKEYGLTPSSLNTFKLHALQVSTLHFRKLDDMRKLAILSINTCTDPEPTSTPDRKSSAERLKQALALVNKLKEDLLRATDMAYEILIITNRCINNLPDPTDRQRTTRELENLINSNPRLKSNGKAE